MTRKKPTIAEMRARKGKGQLTMLRVITLDEAAAAEMAGIDIVSVPDDLVTHPRYREVAPSLFSMTGQTHLEAGTRDDVADVCRTSLGDAQGRGRRERDRRALPHEMNQHPAGAVEERSHRDPPVLPSSTSSFLTEAAAPRSNFRISASSSRQVWSLLSCRLPVFSLLPWSPSNRYLK